MRLPRTVSERTFDAFVFSFGSEELPLCIGYVILMSVIIFFAWLSTFEVSVPPHQVNADNTLAGS